MYPMTISLEKYANHFRPAPDILVVQRYLLDYEQIRRITLPAAVQAASANFVTVGKVLAVSELKSNEEWVEYMKEEIRKSGFVGFAAHMVAQCPALPQFELPKDSHVGLLHVKDVTQILYEFEALLKEQKEYEKKIKSEEGLITK